LVTLYYYLMRTDEEYTKVDRLLAELFDPGVSASIEEVYSSQRKNFRAMVEEFSKNYPESIVTQLLEHGIFPRHASANTIPQLEQNNRYAGTVLEYEIVDPELFLTKALATNNQEYIAKITKSFTRYLVFRYADYLMEQIAGWFDCRNDKVKLQEIFETVEEVKDTFSDVLSNDGKLKVQVPNDLAEKFHEFSNFVIDQKNKNRDNLHLALDNIKIKAKEKKY